MNSGKSANIIMEVYNLREQGHKVSVLKPKKDTRDLGKIKSRALETEIDATLIDDKFDMFLYIYNEKPDFIFVDEVNFLSTKNVEDLAFIVDVLNIPIFTYGLLVDYKGQLFEGSKRMMELADSKRELKSIRCVKCGKKKATMHLRKVNDQYVFDGESIQVGDTDDYESVCRTCYKKAENKRNK